MIVFMYIRQREPAKIVSKEWKLTIVFLRGLNVVSPEGNGRTERVFFVLLIRNAGYDIDYSSLNSDLLMIGSIQAAGGVMDTLIRFFEENIKIH